MGKMERVTQGEMADTMNDVSYELAALAKLCDIAADGDSYIIEDVEMRGFASMLQGMSTRLADVAGLI